MKKIASLILSCALVLFLPAAALAQLDEVKNSTPQERADMQTEWMKSNLTLDAKTSAKVADVNLKYAKEAQATMKQKLQEKHQAAQ